MNINKDSIYKSLRIILISIVIIGCVFNAYNMIGHCASSESSDSYSTDLPFYVGSGWGNNFTASQIFTIVTTCDDAITQNNMYNWTFPDIDAILLYDWDNTYYNFVCLSGEGLFSSDKSTFEPSYCRFASNVDGYTTQIKVTLLKSDLSFSSIGYSSTMDFSNSAWFSSSPSGGYVFNKSVDCALYPVYITDDIVYNNIVYFTQAPTSTPEYDWNTIGSMISNISEIEDSNLPQVDINPPSDTSSIPSWLQKILNALKTINLSIQAVGVTIANNFKNLLDSLKGFLQPYLDSILEKFDSIIDYLSEFFAFPSAQEVFNILSTSQVYIFVNTVKGYFSQLSQFLGVGLTVPQALSFSFNTGANNGYFSNISLTLDFSWYENVRSIVLPVILTFLYCGMALHFYRALPGLIGGVQPFNDSSTNVVKSHRIE